MKKKDLVEKDGKILLSKDLFISYLKSDMKFLNIFQLVGAVVILMLVVMWAEDVFELGEVVWGGYPIIWGIIASIFLLIPYICNRKTKKQINDIKRNNFFVVVDIIKEKDCYTTEFNDKHTWHFVVIGERFGELEISRLEYDSCDIGQQIYVIKLIDETVLFSFPEVMYTLDNELKQFITK